MSTLAGVQIYIFQDSLHTAEPVYGELHVLDSSETTLHYAGSTSLFRDISFWLLDPANYVTIEELYRGGHLCTLVDWRGYSYDSCIIRSLSVTDVLTDIKRPSSLYAVLKVKAKLQVPSTAPSY